MKQFFYLCAITLLVFSCTFEQKIHFNKDWSGDAAFILDMSAMKDLVPPDSTDNGQNPMKSMEESFAKWQDQLSAMEGISDVEVDINDDAGKYKIEFEFASVEALNNCMKGENDMSSKFTNKSGTYFSVKGKNKLIVEIPKMDGGNPDGVDNVEQMGDMANMFKYLVHISFDRKVKKAISGNDIKVKNKHIEQEFTIKDLIEDDFSGLITITLGK